MMASYFDKGTPRLGFDRSTVRALRGAIPWFGKCRSRRKTTQAAAPMMQATSAAKAPKPQTSHSIAVPFEVSDVRL
jgi:hypothetical protein